MYTRILLLFWKLQNNLSCILKDSVFIFDLKLIFHWLTYLAFKKADLVMWLFGTHVWPYIKFVCSMFCVFFYYMKQNFLFIIGWFCI